MKASIEQIAIYWGGGGGEVVGCGYHHMTTFCTWKSCLPKLFNLSLRNGK